MSFEENKELHNEERKEREGVKGRLEDFIVDIRRNWVSNMVGQQRKKLTSGEIAREFDASAKRSFVKLREELQMAETPQQRLECLNKIKHELGRDAEPSDLPIFELFSSNLTDEIFAHAEIEAEGLDPQLRLNIISESMCILSNLCASEGEGVDLLLKRGILPLVQRSILLGDSHVVENSLHCLSNLLADDSSLRQRVEELGIYSMVFEALPRYKENAQLLETAGWMMTNSLRGPVFDSEESMLRIVQRIAKTASPEMHKVICECAWALVTFLEKNTNIDRRIQLVSDLDLEPVLAPVLLDKEPSIVKPVLRVFGYLSYGDESLVKKFADVSLMRTVIQLTESSNRSTQHDALWLFGNIVMTGESYQRILFTGEVLAKILGIIASSPHLGNVTEGINILIVFLHFIDAPQLEFLVSQFQLPLFLLERLNQEGTKGASYYKIVTNAIGTMLEKARILGVESVKQSMIGSPNLTKLVELQLLKDESVAELARKVIVENFETDEH